MTAKPPAEQDETAERSALTPRDDLPIEQWPGWDPVRGVFVLDRSRTLAREATRRKAARAKHEPVVSPATGQRAAH